MCAECFVRGKITKMHVEKFLRASTLKYTQRPRTLAEGVATLFQGVRDYRDSALILDSVANLRRYQFAAEIWTLSKRAD